VSAVIGGAVGAVAGVLAMEVWRKEPISSHPVIDEPQALERSVEEVPFTDLSQIARYLHATLGSQATAYLSGVNDAGRVDRWATGKALPGALASQRLRFAYKAVKYVADAYGAEAAQTWLCGMNPLLDDNSPARVLRRGRSPEDWRLVFLSAREFVEA
jgi:hypothetical protein